MSKNYHATTEDEEMSARFSEEIRKARLLIQAFEAVLPIFSKPICSILH